MAGGHLSGGTGEKLTRATIIVAGVAALVASLLSIVFVCLASNKKLPKAAASEICDTDIADGTNIFDSIMVEYQVYKGCNAFTIYTFFQLLINFIGGERSLIIMMHGREPVNHLWPLNHCLPRVDISDPYSFLAIKRGILQYAWLKPVLGITTIIMKATGTYKEGYLGVDSGYLWMGILYNVSVTLSLYSLGMFWVIMSKDLQPFRPVPKFLCVKLIIFASYWQGFLLSILVWLGAIPDNVEGYTADNLAAAIQDALICIEMPIFAVAHWYAFSWHDYADVTISAARMPVWYAIRDAFGVRDLIEDTKETFSGNKYEYRLFDSGDNVIAHEGSSSRVARMMDGMRYERGGKGKYWIPKPGEATARTPLLSDEPGRSRSMSPKKALQGDPAYGYGNGSVDEQALDPEEERLYERARRLEYGDWNYPVITAHEASRERWLAASPGLLTTSANRNLLQPTRDNQIRRESNIRQTVEHVKKKTERKHSSTSKGKGRSSSKDEESDKATGEEGRAPAMLGMLRHHSSASSSAKSDRSQLVDLVVEDETAEDAERVRARKEGGSSWNKTENKRYVRTYGEDTGEDIREGFDPVEDIAVVDREDSNFVVGEDANSEESEESQQWKQAKEPELLLKPKYGIEGEEFENVWGSGGEHSSPPKENP
ncbi:Transmembrane protein 184-like protein [Lachnellula hyalina]|uniref:Transmembrane protein 184-like protein n=1 Tax=Lachnellula hyalina TaxID=1316788 RepID=A0A8H8TV63_9HELO|nr:Transmembrane protein 184-like protein [Lachnellula hyalina]TVY23022.1 Transmembrane protein 184-like protein [Lachnellula hyalina]